MSQQLGFEAMPRRLFRATPTRLLTWVDCPRRYRFRYLERPAPPTGPPWAHNSLGACVHTALAAWWRLPPAERTVDTAAALLDSGWIDEGYRDRAQSQWWRDRARRMTADYVADVDPLVEPVGIERTVAVKTSGLALSGRIDRIDDRLVDPDADPDADEDDVQDAADPDPDEARATRELVVVDYKTGRRRPTTTDARSSLALAVYAAATWRTLRRRCRRVELHHLPSGQVAGWTHTGGPSGSLHRHLTRAESIGAEAAEAEEAYAAGLDESQVHAWFPPRPGPQCHWCDFAAHCPEGRRAYPTKRSWDGLQGADES